LHHNVENISAGVDSAAVIVESLPPRKKKKNKNKRSISLEEVNRITEDSIKQLNEQRMFNVQRKEKAEEESENKRVPLDQRFRNQLHKMAYGDSRETNQLKEKDLVH
jgi:organic radical activating enzyme